MASHDFRTIVHTSPVTGRFSAPVRSIDPLPCAVTVIAHDVGDVVRAAGGWMLDRVRAGWRVRVVVPDGSDIHPLQILGVKARYAAEPLNARWLRDVPATVATAAETFDQPIGAQIDALQRNYDIEVAVWGDGEIRSALPFDDVRHRLSSAAASFKVRALMATAQSPVVGPCEFFRSSAAWYPLDSGADLQRVESGIGIAHPGLSPAQ
jgi:hypothetical protein